MVPLSPNQVHQLSAHAHALPPIAPTNATPLFPLLATKKKKCHNHVLAKRVRPNTRFNKYTSPNPTNIIGPNFNHQQHMGPKSISISKLGPNLITSSQRQKQIKIKIKTNEKNKIKWNNKKTNK